MARVVLTLTDRESATLAHALSDAIAHRETLAQAWERGPEQAREMKAVREYRKLVAKLSEARTQEASDE